MKDAKEVIGEDKYIEIAQGMINACNPFEMPQVVINDLWVAEKLDFKSLLEKLGEEQYKALFHMMESWPGIADEALRQIGK